MNRYAALMQYYAMREHILTALLAVALFVVVGWWLAGYLKDDWRDKVRNGIYFYSALLMLMLITI